MTPEGWQRDAWGDSARDFGGGWSHWNAPSTWRPDGRNPGWSSSSSGWTGTGAGQWRDTPPWDAPPRGPRQAGGLDWDAMRAEWNRRHARGGSTDDEWGRAARDDASARGRSQQPRSQSRGRPSQQQWDVPSGSEQPASSGHPVRERARTVGFWRRGEWQNRVRTSSEERAHRGGQGPGRQARRGRLQQQWRDGTFRPAAFYRGVTREGPVAEEMRSHFARLLNMHLQPRPSPAWSAQQWQDWDDWLTGPGLLVDWSADGVPDRWMYEDEIDEGSFVQTVVTGGGGLRAALHLPLATAQRRSHRVPADVGAEADHSFFMQLTEDEEVLLDQLHVPTSLRVELRRMMQTLETHAMHDRGPEFRWGVQEFLEAWDRGTQATEHIVGCLRRRGWTPGCAAILSGCSYPS